MKKINKKTIFKIALICFLIIFGIVVLIKILPFIISLKDQVNREAFKESLKSFGINGFFILLAIQILQVIVAIIPGEPIEILAGLLYGTWGGLFICLLGLLIGTVTIFYLVKILGSNFIDKFLSMKETSKLNFLKDSSKIEYLTFILFFIPGTPKDVLTYFVPLTAIKPIRFFIISMVARIPSVISSTFIGENIDKENWSIMILVFILTGILGIIGIFIHNKIIQKNNKK